MFRKHAVDRQRPIGRQTERLTVRLPNGKVDVIRAFARRQRMTLSVLVLLAIRELQASREPPDPQPDDDDDGDDP